jgi:hypothetical protein
MGFSPNASAAELQAKLAGFFSQWISTSLERPEAFG